MGEINAGLWLIVNSISNQSHRRLDRGIECGRACCVCRLPAANTTVQRVVAKMSPGSPLDWVESCVIESIVCVFFINSAGRIAWYGG